MWLVKVQSASGLVIQARRFYRIADAIREKHRLRQNSAILRRERRLLP